jgi:hypothetical protein
MTENQLIFSLSAFLLVPSAKLTQNGYTAIESIIGFCKHVTHELQSKSTPYSPMSPVYHKDDEHISACIRQVHTIGTFWKAHILHSAFQVFTVVVTRVYHPPKWLGRFESLAMLLIVSDPQQGLARLISLVLPSRICSLWTTTWDRKLFSLHGTLTTADN